MAIYNPSDKSDGKGYFHISIQPVNPTACPESSGAKNNLVFTQLVKYGDIDNKYFKPTE